MNALASSGASVLAQRWATLAPRERTLVAIAAVCVAAALLWWVGISPALSKIKQARQAAPQLDAQLQLMRAQAAEAASLKAQRLLSNEESLRSLENAVKSLGAGATLSISGSRASVALRGISADALAQWLAQVRANARLVPSELQIKKSAASLSSPSPSAAATSSATTASAVNAASWDGNVVFNLPAR